jgi:hypothetical protein
MLLRAMIPLWAVRAASVLVSFVWIVVGLLVGGDHALSEYAPSPAAATLAVIYVPFAGGTLLVGAALRHRADRVIATRRAVAGAILCLLLWAVSLVVVLLS